VCCGQADKTAGTAQTICTSSCPTTSTPPNQGQVQVCRIGSGECQNQMQCISQTCLGTAKLDLCGLTSQAPFSCTAN
jgi:hypothetical protein